MYIEISTKRYPISEAEIRNENPNTSYPAPFVTPTGYALVKTTDYPVYDCVTQSLVGGVPKLIKGEYVQQWEVVALSAEEVAKKTQEITIGLLKAAKAARQAEVDNIRVTTSGGKVFDGDETSRYRMGDAIKTADITGIEECVWVLANNIPTVVTKAELEEAFVLSMQAMGAVWAKPYQ